MLSIEENPIKALRTLKGAPLSVYFAIYLAKQTVSVKWIEMVTGYSDKPITKALRLLIEYQYIIKNKRGFVLKTEKQLVFGYEVKKEINYKYLKLHDFGVGEPVLSQIAFNDEISEEYIKNHVEQAEREGIKPNLLIHRIRSGDIVKPFDDPEDYRRYLKGPYGNFGTS